MGMSRYVIARDGVHTRHAQETESRVNHDVALAIHTASAGTARRFVSSFLTESPPVVVGAAELLVSELVTNAVKHANLQGTPGTVGLRVAVEDHLLRVEVSDGDPVMPQVGDGSVDAPSGRGLLIIDRLADRWGCFRAGVGKVVWLELTC